MRCPECGSRDLIETSNLHSVWRCLECGWEGDGAGCDEEIDQIADDWAEYGDPYHDMLDDMA